MNLDLANHSEKFFYFFEIVNQGSLQAAGRKLRISTPTLTYAIKEPELASGVQLLNRSKKGVVPSEAGEKLFHFCRKFFRDLESLQAEMLDLSITSKTKIRIGTFQSIAIYFWPLLLKDLKKITDLSFSLTTNRSKNILESLFKKEIDIAITVESINHPNLIRHELYRDQYAFFSSRHLKKNRFSSEDIKNEPLLFIPDAIDGKGRNLRQYIHTFNLSFKEELELDSFEVICEFIRKNHGIGILPLRVGSNHKDEIKPIVIGDHLPHHFGTHRFYLSHRRDLDLSQPKLNLVLNAAQRAVRLMNRND